MMRAVFLLSAFAVWLVLPMQNAFAQAAGTNPDRCKGIGCVLKGGGIRITIKPAVKKPVIKKPKIKPRKKVRKQNAKPRKKTRKRVAPVKRIKRKTVRRKIVKPVPAPVVPTGPSWEGLPERTVITLNKDDFLPVIGTFLLRFDADNLQTQSINLQAIDATALAALLQIEPFQVRSIQRRFLPGAIVNLSLADATRLSASPLIARLTQDTIIKPASKPNRRLSWGLDRLDQASLPLDGKFQRRKRKGNLRVYLLDSGVDRTHLCSM